MVMDVSIAVIGAGKWGQALQFALSRNVTCKITSRQHKAIEKLGLKQVSDDGAILAIIDAIMSANTDKVAEYRSGKDKLFGECFIDGINDQSRRQSLYDFSSKRRTR